MEKVHVALSPNSPVNALLEYLRKENFEVTSTNSGMETLDVMMSNPPDIALIDASLPEINAFEMIERMRDLDSTSKIPIIVYSETDSEEHREKAMDHEAKDFITGHLDSPKEIALKIKSHLGKQKAYTFDIASDFKSGESIAKDLGARSISCPFCGEILSLYFLRDLNLGKNVFKVSLVCPKCSFKYGVD